MNAQRLLTHYERIADAPDAVARLRRFILDLAVRGKLVPQDPADEPASELLKRIAKEKARLVKAGEFREPASFVKIEREALPFVPAAHWGWSRLIDIARPSYGFAFASSQFNSQKRGVPLIRIRDISGTDTDAYYEGDYDPSYLVEAGDYLVGMDGDFNLRRWKGVDGLLNQRVMRINGWRCGIDPEFIKLPLQFILDHLHGETSLTTVKHLSAKQVNGIEVPLPPLAEQRRIVAKVDELMALCDTLEAARGERETTRDRLTAASLARLGAPVPDAATFREHARFALDHLDALTTRPDQIKQLRRTILDLAVRGKLVPQDPTDEPASELLKRIAKEKARLVKAGEIRKGHPLPPVSNDELPFDLPCGWTWTRLGDLIHLVSGQHLQPPEYSEDPKVGLPYITGPSDFAAEGLQITRFALVRKAVAKKGQLLLTVKGSGVGKTAICDIPEVAISRQLMALTAIEWNDRFLLLITHRLAERLQEEARSLIPGISREDVDEFVFSLPPLAEQRRIVAKVDELMALCDRLEASLATAASTRQRLLEALLAEALTPVDARDVQAA